MRSGNGPARRHSGTRLTSRSKTASGSFDSSSFSICSRLGKGCPPPPFAPWSLPFPERGLPPAQAIAVAPTARSQGPGGPRRTVLLYTWGGSVDREIDASAESGRRRGRSGRRTGLPLKALHRRLEEPNRPPAADRRAVQERVGVHGDRVSDEVEQRQVGDRVGVEEAPGEVDAVALDEVLDPVDLPFLEADGL